MISTGTRAIQYVWSSMLVPLLSVVWLLRDTFKPTKSKKDN